eukprot:6210313-Pleurochrysis_carterae.AAC.2
MAAAILSRAWGLQCTQFEPHLATHALTKQASSRLLALTSLCSVATATVGLCQACAWAAAPASLPHAR